MDNLINFDTEESGKKINSNIEKILSHPLLVTGRSSFDANSNPFDKLEYRSLHIGDPFDILEVKREVSLNPAEISIISTTSTITEKRCQSDSSVSSSSDRESRSRFNSVDNAITKKLNNSLLKLSLLNSPRSPLHSSSLAASMSSLVNNRDLSFEDINNISQHLNDTANTNSSLTDADLKELKISFLESNPLKSNGNPIKVKVEATEISSIQETLKRIKMEAPDEEDVVIKVEDESPEKEQKGIIETKSQVEVDNILQKIKNCVKSNKREDAKKELQRLNEILNEQPKSTLQAPSRYVRQDTFDIDPETGKRKYCQNGEGDGSTGDLMEQLAKLFGTNGCDFNTLNLSGNSTGDTKVVVIMPKSLSPTGAAATPIKIGSQARRSVSMSSAHKPQSALKAIENKKLATPMKSILTPASRRASFAAPNSVPKNPQSRPIEQKSNVTAARKSLMPSLGSTPSRPQRKPSPNTGRASTATVNVRRSISLKEKIPVVNLTTPTPTKARPVTSYGTPSKVSKVAPPNNPKSSLATSTKRLSTAPTSTRPAVASSSSRLSMSTTASKSSTLNSSIRPILRKTEFKTPYAASKKPSTAKGSLV